MVGGQVDGLLITCSQLYNIVRVAGGTKCDKECCAVGASVIICGWL